MPLLRQPSQRQERLHRLPSKNLTSKKDDTRLKNYSRRNSSRNGNADRTSTSRSTRSHIRWIVLLVAICVARMMYQSVTVISSSMYDSGQYTNTKTLLDAPSQIFTTTEKSKVSSSSLRRPFFGNTDTIQQQGQQQKRRKQRQQNSRPPLQTSTSSSFVSWPLSNTGRLQEVPNSGANPEDTWVVDIPQDIHPLSLLTKSKTEGTKRISDSEVFCKGLSGNVTILISGMVHHPLAMETIWQLHHHHHHHTTGTCRSSSKASITRIVGLIEQESLSFSRYGDSVNTDADAETTDMDHTLDIHSGDVSDGIGWDTSNSYAQTPLRAATLLHDIPHLELYSTRYPNTLLSQQEMDEIVRDLHPTHILYFEPTSHYGLDDSHSGFADAATADAATTTTATKFYSNQNRKKSSIPENIAIRQSLEGMERLGRSLVTIGSSARVIHITKEYEVAEIVGKTTQMNAKAIGSKQMSRNINGNRNIGSWSVEAQRLIYQTFWQTFRERYNLDVVQLELPPLYGPFEESAVSADKLLNNIMELKRRSHNNFTQIENRAISAADNIPMMHIDDAVMYTMLSLSTRHRSKETHMALPIFQVATSTTVREIINAISSEVADTTNNTDAINPSTKLLNDRTKLILSWSHHRNYTYQDPGAIHVNETKTALRKVISMANRRLEKHMPQGISLKQRRQAFLFPCASECSANVPCDSDSVFTNEILMLSRNLTFACKFAVYMADFSENLESLPELRTLQNSNIPWPKEQLCQVAFVSSQSKLVQTVVPSARSSQSILRTQNGQHTHNGWTLIWISSSSSNDNTNINEGMSVSDQLLPKLSPRTLFAKNISKVMYLDNTENLDPQKLPPKPIIFYLLAKNLDAKRQLPRIKHGRRPGASVIFEYWLPYLPARHIVLFANSGGKIHPGHSIHSIVTRRLLKQGNTSSWYPQIYSDRLPRQWQYYEFARSVYPMTVFPDTSILIHNLEAPHARSIRCDWYAEQLFWNATPGTEDLALAYVLSERRGLGRLRDIKDTDWGERLIEPYEFGLVGNASLTASQYFVKLHSRRDK